VCGVICLVCMHQDGLVLLHTEMCVITLATGSNKKNYPINH